MERLKIIEHTDQYVILTNSLTTKTLITAYLISLLAAILEVEFLQAYICMQLNQTSQVLDIHEQFKNAGRILQVSKHSLG